MRVPSVLDTNGAPRRCDCEQQSRRHDFSPPFARKLIPTLRQKTAKDGAPGKSAQPAVIHYIHRQAEHHRKRSFDEELKLLLEKHGIKIEE